MPKLTIARGARWLGEWDDDDVVRRLEAGSLLDTDVYWKWGDERWEPLASLRPGPKADDPAEGALQDGRDSAAEPGTGARAEAVLPPATQEQIAYLMFHNASFDPEIREAEARAFIDYIRENPGDFPTEGSWEEAKFHLFPHLFQRPDWMLSPREKKARCWAQIGEAETRLQDPALSPDERDAIGGEVAHLKEQLVAAVTAERVALETARAELIERIELWRGHMSGKGSLLFARFAPNYLAPGREQVAAVLDYLDRLNPDWERLARDENPALPFMAYERLYPEALREGMRSAHRSRDGSPGCLILAAAGTTATVAAWSLGF